MDKGDVEMEDAVKGPQDVENAEEQTRDDSVVGKLGYDGKELPLSDAGGDEGKSDGVTDENNLESNLEVLRSEKSEVDVEEAGDPNDKRSQEGKDAEETNDVMREEVKDVEEPNVVKSEGVKEAGDPDMVKVEGAKEAEDVMNEARGVKAEVEDRDNDKTEAKSEKSEIESDENGENASENGGHGQSKEQKHSENAILEENSSVQGIDSVKLAADEASQNETGAAEEVQQSKDEATIDVVLDEPKESGDKTASVTATVDRDVEMAEAKESRNGVSKTDQSVNEEMVDVAKDPENKTVADGKVELCSTPVAKREVDGTPVSNHDVPSIPTAVVKCASASNASHSGEVYKNFFNESKVPGDDDGTPEEQAAFMKELESFYRERALEFKPPRFYGQQLNCLKLWRAVIRLGGYDRVTGSKLWRQVGESFHPPKTCTTVSWTFRIFYEKALLEYERYMRESGMLQLPIAIPDPSSVDTEGNGFMASGSGRARRDAAARAMQGWHTQRLFGSGEVSEPTTKDKNFNNMPKREKNLKSIGSLKQKRPNEVEHPVKVARTETSKQLVASVVDVGPPADWVKINVRETKDCFEVYALVPGLLREEVRVQSDPAGRLVITGQPEQLDNPWGITAFKKVVSLPGRIDPLQTSAVVSLHGRLFVRVPFEQSNI